MRRYIRAAVVSSIALMQSSALHAGSVTVSTTPPVTNDEDIAVLTEPVMDKDAGHKWWDPELLHPGQQFTTGDRAVAFQAFTLQTRTAVTDPDFTMTMRVSTVSGDTLKPITTETMRWTQPCVSASYVTFKFEDAVQLAPNTQYAVDVSFISPNGKQWPKNIPYLLWDTEDHYAGGDAYLVKTNAMTISERPSSRSNKPIYDFSFHIDLEPSASDAAAPPVTIFGR